METNIIRPKRVFKLGALALADPDPALSPEKVLEVYTPNYPFLAHSTVSEPKIVGDELHYEVERPPVRTKGAVAAPLAHVCALPDGAQLAADPMGRPFVVREAASAGGAAEFNGVDNGGYVSAITAWQERPGNGRLRRYGDCRWLAATSALLRIRQKAAVERGRQEMNGASA